MSRRLISGCWIDQAILDGLYTTGKLTVYQREQVLSGADPTPYGLSAYDLAALTCGRLGAVAHGPRAHVTTASPGSQSDASRCADLKRPGYSSLSSALVSTLSEQLLPPDGARLGLIVKNAGPAVVLLAYADESSPAAYTLDLLPGAVLVDSTGWTGALSAVTASSSAQVFITTLS